MNKSKFQIIDILSPSQISLLEKAKNLTTIADQATSDSIVFYRLVDVASVAVLKRRASKSSALFYVVEASFKPDLDFDHVVVNREQFEFLQVEFCRKIYPTSDDVKLIGVTGTNGKSSVVNYCAKLLKMVGVPSLAIGTIGISDGDKIIDQSNVNTTPSYLDLMGIVFKNQTKYKNFIFEFSSHALHQRRLLDIKLDVAAWTSFSQDHLDYHKTMESYFDAKMIIFDHLKDENSKVVVPYQQDFSYKILNTDKCRNRIAFTKNVDQKIAKLHFVYKQGFNLENIEIALQVVSLLGHPQVFNMDLSEIRPPAGRFEIVSKGEKHVVVDYAHTPDALLKVLESAKSVFLGKKLHVVFGCGGDRDAKKRPVMGRVAAEWADKITITSDNPRSEDPQRILQDILFGIVDKSLVSLEVDRRKAIEKAIMLQGDDEVVIVAGKGHENTQEIMGVKHHFNDKELVEKLLY